jgi:hypothetical protein
MPKQKRPKEPMERRIQIRILDTELAEADRIANARRWTRSAAVRWLLEQGLASNAAKSKS